MAKQRSVNLYARYIETEKREKKKLSRAFVKAMPVVLVLLLMGWVYYYLTTENIRLEDELLAAEALSTDEKLIADSERAKEILDELAEASMRKKAFIALDDTLYTYPKVGTSVVETLEQASGEDVVIFVSGYDSLSGEIVFTAATLDVLEIPSYIARLEETGLFESVKYEGYAFESQDEYLMGTGMDNQGVQAYTVMVRGVLKSALGREAQQ